MSLGQEFLNLELAAKISRIILEVALYLKVALYEHSETILSHYIRGSTVLKVALFCFQDYTVYGMQLLYDLKQTFLLLHNHWFHAGWAAR